MLSLKSCRFCLQNSILKQIGFLYGFDFYQVYFMASKMLRSKTLSKLAHQPHKGEK